MGRRDKSRLYNFFVLLRTPNSPFLQLPLSPIPPFSNSPFLQFPLSPTPQLPNSPFHLIRCYSRLRAVSTSNNN